ncbi:MAG TPA: tetraacyldisaccharide 4'-kinase, partial [Bryobacteraceae bacterium]|nr:tetraacyldisaccharide 4'-kinase [Bryobacteraceae bacterium]
GHLIPLGRLREPLEGLARADAFVITRADEIPDARPIENVLRRYNQHAPVFRARTVPQYWTNARGDRIAPEELRRTPAAGFCGLGNPDAFWQTLARLGIRPLERHAYPDHHHYSPAEIRRLAQHARDNGAAALLTTAKDAVNLGAHCEALVAPLELCWLEIGIEIEGAEDLIQRIRTKTGIGSGIWRRNHVLP